MITDNLCTCGHPDHFHHNTGECAGLPNGDVRINKGFTGCTCRKFEPVGAVCTCGHTKDRHLEYFGDGLFRCEICSCTEFEPAGEVKSVPTSPDWYANYGKLLARYNALKATVDLANDHLSGFAKSVQICADIAIKQKQPITPTPAGDEAKGFKIDASEAIEILQAQIAKQSDLIESLRNRVELLEAQIEKLQNWRMSNDHT